MMIRPACSGAKRVVLQHLRVSRAQFSSSAASCVDQANESVELDSSFKTLLQEVDISLLRNKNDPDSPAYPHRPAPRELEALLTETTDVQFPLLGDTENVPSDEVEYHSGKRDARKSPAALFGSQAIGQVVLPHELQKSISQLIGDSDKIILHSDARRLFSSTTDGQGQDVWQTEYDLRKYRSLKQAGRHAVRDGTAFASIALPAHYAAIYAVLDHVKQRLEPGWKVENVIDWGAGTGSGLWASAYAFQKPSAPVDNPQVELSNLRTYIGIDKREGLVTIAKRLLRNVNNGSLNTSWQKTWKDDDKMNRTKGTNTLSMSAFMLSALPTAQSRKVLIKEMWESGAEVMVLIDHSTSAGFECIAEAREYLLKLGRKEFDDPAAVEWDIHGSHVVAPCPHDGACPLYHHGASKLVCGFSQRLQRPSFVRLTKHSGIGHEDTRYSYVVIRRGKRPSAGGIKAGRVGAVAREVIEKNAAVNVPLRELEVHHEGAAESSPKEAEDAQDHEVNIVATGETQPSEEIQDALRLEAYAWPRLVFPPMKRSGHIILDSCTAEGKVMRITIPKSQGKQEYYDARKASWGDMFPHEPKNKPQERYQPPRKSALGGPVKGADIGKSSRNKEERNVATKTSYANLADSLKEKKKKTRVDRLRLNAD